MAMSTSTSVVSCHALLFSSLSATRGRVAAAASAHLYSTSTTCFTPFSKPQQHQRRPRHLSPVQLFNVNVRKMSGMLVGEPKYSFLKELGLGEVNDGVYDGKWFGSGEVSGSIA